MSADRTPAPVAVNVEIDSDDLRRHAELLADEGEHGPAHVLFTAAKHIEAGGDIPEWMGKPAAPRPEPVVAPLPTEGWSTPLDLDHLRGLANLAGGVWDGNSWRPDAVTVARADRDVLTTPFPTVAKFCEAFDPPTALRLLDELERLRRLVPEDDEDTVRVPREAVERLHPRGTIRVPMFDEFDSPTRDGCTTCRQSWPCDTLRLLDGPR